MLENKVRSFATDLVRSLSSCFGQLPNSLAVNQNNCLPASTSQVAMALKLMSLIRSFPAFVHGQDEARGSVQSPAAEENHRQPPGLHQDHQYSFFFLIIIKIMQIVIKHCLVQDHPNHYHQHHDDHQVGALSPMMLASTGRRLQVSKLLLLHRNGDNDDDNHNEDTDDDDDDDNLHHEDNDNNDDRATGCESEEGRQPLLLGDELDLLLQR